MNDHCSQCNGYDPHGDHPADCYYQQQARLERRANSRESRSRFQPWNSPFENVRIVGDGEDRHATRAVAECPECGTQVEMSDFQFRGRVYVKCPADDCWYSATFDYSGEREAVA